MPIYRLQPVCKDYMWGGSRLQKEYQIKSDLSRIAESWMLACHRDGTCMVDGSSQSLAELLHENPSYVGKKGATYTRFPLMVKLIHACGNLSIQVHPDDAMAAQLENDYGKNEMWYVLDAKKDAYLYDGFRVDMTQEKYQKAIEDGTICDFLNKVYVKPGDVIYVEAGTVHAIAEGLIIAEIQQNSNATYRIYDYNRLDKDGNPRPLDIDKAVQATHLHAMIPIVTPQLKKRDYTTFTKKMLVQNRYFQVDEYDIYVGAVMHASEDSFLHVLCIEGDGCMQTEHEKVRFSKGDSFFVAAGSGEIKIRGESKLLVSSL